LGLGRHHNFPRVSLSFVPFIPFDPLVFFVSFVPSVVGGLEDWRIGWRLWRGINALVFFLLYPSLRSRNEIPNLLLFYTLSFISNMFDFC
jgi:hypothetical protein